MTILPHDTHSLCAACLAVVPASVVERDGAVWMLKTCPRHGAAEILLSPDAQWYRQTVAQGPHLQAPAPPVRPVAQGCPLDCGPCAQHEMGLQLPIVPITAACNLDCPICYTHNHNAGGWHLSEAALDAILVHLRRLEPNQRIINLTGGEPTEHPDFMALVQRCADAGIHRITLSTHGLRFLQESALLPLLAALDARVVLSFDSLRDDANRAMLGGALTHAKLRILDLLDQHKVSTTLLPVVAKGHNDDELGQFVRLVLDRPYLRSLELHTMTFTGQSGTAFDRQARLTTLDVLRLVQVQTQGLLRVSDFVPAPAAHALCYQVAYLLRLGDGQWLPFTRFMAPANVRAMLAGTLYLEPGPQVDAQLHEAISRLYAGDVDLPEAPLVLASLKAMLGAFFAAQGDPLAQMRAGEDWTKAVYVHAHMDAENFDTDRIRQCCVSIVEPDGQTVPSCAYNVLYRNRDVRFVAKPLAAVATLGIGRIRGLA